MAKDERRLTSKDGHAIQRKFQHLSNVITAGLIDLQTYALDIKDETLAKKVNDLMKSPIEMNELLNEWDGDDIDSLISLIEGKR